MRMTVLAAALALAATQAAAMSLQSNDFADGAPIPVVHNYPRCGGQNVSPELHWSGVPETAKSLVLTMIDQDVKPARWSHWIVVGLPVATAGLARGVAALPAGAHTVVSNFGDAAYAGPCPPEGSGTHRYKFTIWALPATTVTIAPDAKANEVEAMLMGLALDHESLVGTVRR